MSNRLPRRQGVVYGPPRPPQDQGAGRALIGRAVGLGMVGLAVAVLVGAVVLVTRPPAATPTRQVGPTPSSTPQTPSAAPSGQPSNQPSASPASTSPAPSPFVPTVQAGPGFVTFGTRLKSDRAVADPRASFIKSDRIAWSGHLTEASDAADITVRLLKLDSATPGGERLLSEGGARPTINDSDRFARSGIRPGRDLDGPGIYLVRYLKGDAVLAEGYFELRE